jgi:uncharacterized membrane protein
MNKQKSARNLALLLAKKHLNDHSQLTNRQIIEQLEKKCFCLAREGRADCAASILAAMALLEMGTTSIHLL